ncbi:MAG: CCA-adding enzyme [Verrucomicrobia bacterium ADurb.Bin345]|nr:MAG: CCA-adding enzyme [Verrucomicrobia bacterium ADurb.Bin345]
MGRIPRDYDIATDAPPSAVRELFPRVIEVGAAFGVSRVMVNDVPTEVAAFRADIGTADGRHPAEVRFCGAEEDAKRRDFTINGMFYDPIEDRIIDYVEGRRDVERKVVRAIGDADERFREDYLRMLRAVRFASTLAFELDPRTAEAIARQSSHIAEISAERIQYELTRMLTESPRPGSGLNLLLKTGLLPIILPEVAAMAGQEQSPDFHPEGDVFTHTVQMLDSMPSNPPVTLAYAVLLHDVGKPASAETVRDEDGTARIRFHGHAERGAEMTEEILRRLRMPSQLIEDVVHCVCNHMRLMNVREMRESKLRRLVAAPTFDIELELHRLDCVNSHGNLENHHFLRAFIEELGQAPRVPRPWITGHDLMAMGIPEGPEIGRWHRIAHEAQMENRFASREELLKWIRTTLADTGLPQSPSRDTST